MPLVARDKKVIWHPFTQHLSAALPIAVTRAKGAKLYDEQGRSYIDAISSWWVNLHGHCNEYIASKVAEQFATLDHVLFAGFTHEPAVKLAERLLTHLPKNQARIFYSDDGSTSVEVALKMAIQYQRQRGGGAKRIIAFENGYHGDTFGAMAASDRGMFVAPFSDFLFEVNYLPAPGPDNSDLIYSELRKLLERGEVAAFIFEPLIQGAGGMNIFEPGLLNELIALCRSKNVLTIADEVMTGFYRTGRFVACEYLSISPDIFCLSKGITGGVIPLGVTSCSADVFDGFLSEDRRRTFFHGHSYTANPLACSAALASLDLLERPECMEAIKLIAQKHLDFVSELKTDVRVINPRTLGTVLAFEVQTSETGYLSSVKDTLYRYFTEHGVLLRPLGNTVYIMPPYCISSVELAQVYTVIVEGLAALKCEDQG